MPDKTIEQIIDIALQKWIDIGLNKRPGKLEPEMSAGTDADGWTTWFPIPSKVTDEEIQDFEQQIGYPLPEDFKRLLKHKHFYDLHISEADFTLPVNTWRYALASMIDNGYPREFLIDKGYLPFITWSDWGMLCFDTNRDVGHHDYPVVLWDHEAAHKVTPFSDNFSELMTRLDLEESDRVSDGD